MDRKFVIALSSLAGSVMLSEAHAIGLGEIRLRSSLNEPLRADIKLLQVNDLSENEIIVGLAPKKDFDAANVDRDFLLNSLRFRLDLDDPKNPKVVVTTQQPLREPFLNFLVEVQWPSGRLLREYTLLMDLPAFSNSKPSASVGEATVSRSRKPVEDDEYVEPAPKPRPVKAPVSEAAAPKTKPASAPVQKQPAPAAESTAPAVEKESKPAPRGVSSDGSSYGPTNSSDTTWRIAQSVKGAGSVQQKILAIQRLNPNAFSNGNVNLLKKGQVLKLPSQEEIASIGRDDALAQFSEQNEAWKTGRKLPQVTGAPMDATGRAPASAPVAAQPDGQLKLAAPTTTASDTQAVQGSGDPKAEVAALQNDLAVGQEELSRAQRENQEIASRAKDLDAQKENAERLLQLQSSEMAAMQAKLAEEQQAKAAADALAAQAAADAQAKAAADVANQAAADAQAKAAADALAAQAAADAQAKAAADAQAKAAADAATAASASVAESAPASENAPATADTQTAATIAEPEQPAAPVEAAAAPESSVQAPASVAPVKQPVSDQSPVSSLMDALMGNPLIGGVVAAILILLAVLGLRKKSKGTVEESAYEEAEAESAIEYTGHEYESPVEQESSAEDAELESGWDLDATADEVVAEASEPTQEVQPETGDVLGEADIYISFGNFDKGEALLKSAIFAEPSRLDYRMKLLELYKESSNLTGFDEAYKNLIELDDDVAIAKAADLRSKISGAAATPFAFGVSAAAAAAGISDEDEFDLDLDMDFAAPVAVEPEISSPAAESEQHVDLTSAVEEPPFFDVDFDLDSGADFASGVTSIHEAVAVVEDAPVAEEAFSLDFDLDDSRDFASNATSIHEAVVPAAVDEVPAAESQVYSEQETAMLDAVTADAGDLDEDLDFLSDADEAATKLDLARAYIDMGDKDGARDILAEVLEEGRGDQKSEAQALLDSIN